ncbi:uncharacterized protein LOC105457711 [Trichonephila clavipes]|nr:uncharacterized protein LOC105457711 [Trichonephila clavipes]
MSCKNIILGDIPIIANSLKCGTTRAVKTLNSILGFTEFDRSSRNKIKKISTFPKEFRVEEHKEKILTEFSLPDFISVANLLHLDVETNEQNLCNSIFKALTNLDEFQLTLNNSEASFSEGENVVSKTNHVRQEFFIGRDRPALPFSTTSGHLSKSCPNHSRGPRCLSCNLYGHKSFECRRANLNNTSTPPSGVNAAHELPSPINMCKDIVRVQYFVRGGFVRHRSRASSKHLSSHLLVDGARFLGGQKGVALQVQDARVGVGSTKKPIPLDVDVRRSDVTALTDDELIFHKPRRLPFAERDIVDAQVDEWVKNGIVEAVFITLR